MTLPERRPLHRRMPAPWWAAAILALAWLLIPALTEAGSVARPGDAARATMADAGANEYRRS